MGEWYRAGSVEVVNASPNVVGTGTLWNTQASVGDIFTLDGAQFYEISEITDDTHIVLKSIYLGESAVSQEYAIIRNFAATPNGTLAARLAELLNRWHTREDEWYAWHNGTVDGGPLGDGRYPFTDADGDIIYIACPALMMHDTVAGEIDALSEKTTMVDDDVVVIEDSESSPLAWAKKKVKKSTMKKMETAVDATLSGAPKVFVVYDSAGTPYYLKAYPTKS